MISLVLAMMLKEQCHDFDCHKVASFKKKACHLQYEFNPNARFGDFVGTATIEGETFPMRWFQDGPARGFVGQNGRHGLSLFLEGKHLRAYWLSDTTTMDYTRIQCKY